MKESKKLQLRILIRGLKRMQDECDLKCDNCDYIYVCQHVTQSTIPFEWTVPEVKCVLEISEEIAVFRSVEHTPNNTNCECNECRWARSEAEMAEEERKNDLRLLNNFIRKMPKTYRKRNVNWVIVRDLLMSGTSTMGRTSCKNKCIKLGIKPDEYDFEELTEGRVNIE